MQQLLYAAAVWGSRMLDDGAYAGSLTCMQQRAPSCIMTLASALLAAVTMSGAAASASLMQRKGLRRQG